MPLDLNVRLYYPEKSILDDSTSFHEHRNRSDLADVAARTGNIPEEAARTVWRVDVSLLLSQLIRPRNGVR